MKYYQPTDKNILILGRTAVQNPLPLFWTGSGLEFDTDSSELWFDLESDYETFEEWIAIEVDGYRLQRTMVSKGRSRICAFRGLPTDVKRRVRLIKEVQPMRDDEKRYLLVHGVECDGEIYAAPRKKLKIEVVGDSLSSGEGLSGSRKLMSAGPAMFGTEGHYAFSVADHFEAELRILSQSGWGVYSSCYNDLIRIMPKYYEQVCGVLTGAENEKLGAFAENDFSKWQPDVVIINLGSNDGFALDREAWVNPEDGRAYRQITNPYGGVEEESALRFESAVVDFLKKVRKYNPNAYILWAYGMCDHTMWPYLTKAVARYCAETGDARAEFQLLPTTTMKWAGSSGHPGVRPHAYAAEILIEKLEQVLGEA